ncbi:acetylxylan esterase [Paenibacillus protaetiae]|uniref:Acetylesterase n=1 Tax=Paenibacillus protaetiae TaxID=2509456 RepID=A0A4P6F0C3_9BACL|nr:alpha/beta fold hydrolase [Paenibacillus protaetiae]QAY67529.1 acetylesterase [Paenibacillus protaetiae]
MNAIEKRIEELYRYNPDLQPPSDLEQFWNNTLETAEQRKPVGQRVKTETPFAAVDAYHVTYEGYDHTPIKGWYIVPKFVQAQGLPCVVVFHGYTGGKSYPEHYADWLLMGMAVLAVDVRGQGGETGNRMDSDYGMIKGWVTQGILDKEKSYYKAIAVDAVKAIEWAAIQPEVDASRIAVCGDSQGGGISLLAAALSMTPAVAVANIPNMCHMDFGILNSTGSLTEAAEFVHRFPQHLDKVLNTLSYFDMVHLARRIEIPVMVSAGLKDTVCLPETVFAAYNRIPSEKILNIYPFTGHSVGDHQKRQAYEFVKRHLI